jgi:hypothetical protein
MPGSPVLSFLEPVELKSAVYEYQVDQITESDTDIPIMAINAAIEEVKSYLAPGDQVQFRDGRKRYDVAAIFSASGAGRNPLVLELTKSIAVYYLMRLANVDIIAEEIRKRYDRAIDWLEKVSATGKYDGKVPLNANLPVLPDIPAESDDSLPFRSGSREKFLHE